MTHECHRHAEIEGTRLLEDHFIEKMTALRTTHDPNSPIILHYNPKFLEVKLGDLVSHMIGEDEFSIDLFNSVMRRLNQKNQSCTLPSKNRSNRHYFEAEFLQSIIEGDFTIDDPYINDELVDSHLNNQIQQCSMLYFPAKFQDRWILYTWEININELTVFDPSYKASTAAGPDKIHYYTIRCLKRCMSSISKKILKGWRQDFHMVRIKFMDHYRSTRECLSGLMCSYFCMTYNGSNLDKIEGQIGKCCVAAMVLSEVISIEGNSGSVPSDLAHVF